MTQIKKGKVAYPYSKLLHALEEVASMHESYPKGTVRRFGLNRNKLKNIPERHMGRPFSGFRKGSRLNRAKKYTAAQLMAQCDSNAPYPIDAEWENMPAVGKELQW